LSPANRSCSANQGGAYETQRTQPAQRQDCRRDQGATTSHVKVDIGQGIIVTSAITNEAVTDLGLKKGDDAWAIIKASDVMIGK
jgi:molybdopterin-binding protein